MTATALCKFNLMSQTTNSGETLPAPTPVGAAARLGFFAAILETVGKTYCVPTSNGAFYSPLSPI